jgi:hypothetical protein
MKLTTAAAGAAARGRALRSSSGSVAMFAAIRLASSRVRPTARQAVRRGDYVGNRGKTGSARLALEMTFMTHCDTNGPLYRDCCGNVITSRGPSGLGVGKR